LSMYKKAGSTLRTGHSLYPGQCDLLTVTERARGFSIHTHTQTPLRFREHRLNSNYMLQNTGFNMQAESHSKCLGSSNITIYLA